MVKYTCSFDLTSLSLGCLPAKRRNEFASWQIEMAMFCFGFYSEDNFQQILPLAKLAWTPLVCIYNILTFRGRDQGAETKGKKKTNHS